MVVYFGVIGAIWAQIAFRGGLLVVEYFILHRLIGLTIRELVRMNWRTVAASVVMLAAVYALREAMPDQDSLAGLLVSFLACVGLGVVVFSGSLLALWAASGKPPESAEQYSLIAIKGVIATTMAGRA